MCVCVCRIHDVRPGTLWRSYISAAGGGLTGWEGGQVLREAVQNHSTGEPIQLSLYVCISTKRNRPCGGKTHAVSSDFPLYSDERHHVIRGHVIVIQSAKQRGQQKIV